MELPGHAWQSVNQIDQNSEATTQSTRPDGGIVGTPRNTLGSVGAQSGAGVLPASFGYDAAGTGQMTSLTTYRSGTLGDQSTGSSTAWAYDPATGQLFSKTFADGSQDQYYYNAEGQLTGLYKPGLDYSNIAYTHGQLSSSTLEDATTGTVSTNITSRDELGRPVVTTDQDNGKTFTEDTTYNAQQQLATATFGSAGGAMLDYQYGPSSGFSSTQEPGAIDTVRLTGLPGEQPQPATGYSYDPISKRLQSVTINGVTLTYGYLGNSNQVNTMSVGSLLEQWLPDNSDQARIAWINATDLVRETNLLQDLTFNGQYNQQDQRTAEYLTTVDAVSGTSSSKIYGYTYDSTRGDALTGVTINGTPTYSYAFDGVGNFTSNNGITASLGAANSLNQYSNLSYNGRGDITGDGSYTYGYDAEDRLISVTPNTPASGSTQEQYGYDSKGRRLWMDVNSWNPSSSAWQYAYSRHYVWDGNQLSAVLDQNNVLLQQYTYGPMGLAAITDYSANPTSPKTYIVIVDAHGNTAELIDPGNINNGTPATVVADYYYDPYGRLLSSSGPAAGFCIILGKGYIVSPETPWLGLAPNPTGDGPTRVFNFNLDLFMQRDPSGEINGGLNLEQAFGGDPINNVDPSGDAPASDIYGVYLSSKQQQEQQLGRALTDDEDLALWAGVLQSQAMAEQAAAHAPTWGPFEQYGFCAACHGSLDGGRVNIAAFQGDTSQVSSLQWQEIAIATGQARQLSDSWLSGLSTVIQDVADFSANAAAGFTETMTPAKVRGPMSNAGFVGRVVGRAAGAFVSVGEMITGAGADGLSIVGAPASAGVSLGGLVVGSGLIGHGAYALHNAFQPLDTHFTETNGEGPAAEGEGEGIPVNNSGIPNPMVEVTRTTPSELINAARSEFNSTRVDAASRANFLRQFADTPGAKSYFSDSELARMQAGKAPDGWVVHHMQPLFRGGDNSVDNLILVPEQWHTDNFFDLHFYPEGRNPFGKN